MTSTPWGKSQSKKVWCRGVTFHSTSSHGGFMVSKGFAHANLSRAAIERAFSYGNYLCYEEDCAAEILFFELPGLRVAFLSTSDPVKCLSLYYPDYLIQRGLEPYAEEYARHKRWQTVNA